MNHPNITEQEPDQSPDFRKPTEEVINSLERLFDFRCPRAYQKHLHEVWGIYLMYIESTGLPYEFSEIAESMYFLIKFFEGAYEEMKGVGNGAA